MNKKAIAMKTLVELIFFALVTILIALPIIMKMVGFFVEEPETGTKKSLEALAIEINNLNIEKPPMPVYVDRDHFIRGYKAGDKEKPKIRGCEEDEACLCICSIKEQCNAQDKKMQCRKLEFDLEGDVEIKPKLVDKDGKLDPNGNPIVQNCLLKKENKEVTVSCS